MVALLECFVAQVAEMGVKGAVECVHPAAGKAVDLFRGVWQKWRERRRLDQMRDEVAKIAQMTADQVVTEVRATLDEAVPGRHEMKREIELYLSLLPGAVRQSLKRADDPTGCSAPIDLQLAGPTDLVRLFPAGMPHLRPGDPLPGLSSWTLTHPLGAGGFGEVWLATHAVESSRRSAVKFCTEPSAKLPLIEHELIQVVRLMRAGGHANIVPLLEYNLGGDRPWLMYEYVGGGTLADCILEWQRLEAGERVRKVAAALSELAAAVAYLHRLDPPLVHRDLKPANVLRCGDTGRLRVTDLGLGGSAVEYVLSAESRGGRAVTGRLPTLLFGSHSLHYASPEQRKGAPPDPRDDVHALGVIAYQMLLGKLDAVPGFDTVDDLQDAGAPDDLIALVGRCVSQRADRRPRDAGEVATALVPLALGEGLGVRGQGSETKLPPGYVPLRLIPSPPAPLPPGRGEQISLPLRGRWWSQPVTAAKPTWKAVCDTPAEVTLADGEVYRLELPARVTDAELAGLDGVALHPRADAVVRLDLSGCEQISDSGLLRLTRLPGLRHLNLYGCGSLTDAGLAPLSKLTHLTRLDLTRCSGLTDAALVPVGELPALEHLSLGGCEWITDSGLVHLARAKTLKTVSVRGTQVTDAGAERLKRAVPGCAVEL
jgi:serine/threonine protein kinase